MGLNRHRRGYVIKEAASRRTLLRCRVLLGPPGLNFKSSYFIFILIVTIIISSGTVNIFKILIITTDTIALSIAYGPTLVIRDIKEFGKQTYHMHLSIKQFLFT